MTANANLSELVGEACAGEEIVIARGSEPVVKLVLVSNETRVDASGITRIW